MTWFRNVENEQEYRISKERFTSYITSHSIKIGNSNLQTLEKILQAIAVNEERCLHFYFKGSCTFHFVGDSIIEGQMGYSGSILLPTVLCKRSQKCNRI